VSVAVLGASGFIGRWVARALTSGGARLFLIVRARRCSEEIFSQFGVRGTVVEADLRRDAVEVLARIRPSITFNLAGYGVDPSERNQELAERTNADLVKEICAGVARARDSKWPGQHIVHTGSALEYGEAPGRLSEDSEPIPTTDYGRSKLRGTQALAEGCRIHSLNGVTARLFNVYGPGEHRERLLPTLLAAAHTESVVELTAGDQRRDFTYVEDVAEGLLRLGVAAPMSGGVVNLATGRLTSVRAFIETAARVLGLAPDRLRFGAIPLRQGEMSHQEVVVARLIEMLGWKPATSIEAGVSRTRDFAIST
jgi:nucleoside-diphosphate-sugar epimerase